MDFIEKFHFQSQFSIHLFNQMTRKYLCRINVLKKILIEKKNNIRFNITQWFFELKWLSICRFYVKLNGLKMSSEIEVSIQCFWQRFLLAQCIVASNVLTVTDKNREWCIFPILPVNVLWSDVDSNWYDIPFYKGR